MSQRCHHHKQSRALHRALSGLFSLISKTMIKPEVRNFCLHLLTVKVIIQPLPKCLWHQTPSYISAIVGWWDYGFSVIFLRKSEIRNGLLQKVATPAVACSLYWSVLCRYSCSPLLLWKKTIFAKIASPPVSQRSKIATDSVIKTMVCCKIQKIYMMVIRLISTVWSPFGKALKVTDVRLYVKRSTLQDYV